MSWATRTNLSSIQMAHRSTKLYRCWQAIAFHGLSLNVYADEDMDLDEEDSSVIIEDFNKAKSIEEIDKAWRKHSAAIYSG